LNELRSIMIRRWVPLRDALLKSGLPSIAVIGVQRSERREGPTTEVAILVRVAATEAKIELSYTLALSRWAAMGKASSSLLVNLPKAFLTSVIRAARAASFACDTGPANGEPAT
jgi:hypothetical protein